MKLSEIHIGDRVGVSLGAQTTETHEFLGLQMPTAIYEFVHHDRRSGITGGRVPAVVSDIGVPYKKGRHGVTVEMTWEQERIPRCTCSQCGDQHIPRWWVETEELIEIERETRTRTVTVHYSMLQPWMEVLTETVIRDAEWEAKKAAWREKRYGPPSQSDKTD